MPERPNPAARLAGANGWLRGIRRVAFFSLFWVLLGGGSAGSWIVGAPMVIAATFISLRLWHGPSLSLAGLLRFLPWFARQSMAGAVDVAVRALRPAMPLAPGTVRHHLRLPADGASRIALANVVSMLPGTLSADLEGDALVVHALDARQDLHRMITDLEPRIASVFGVALEAAA